MTAFFADQLSLPGSLRSAASKPLAPGYRQQPALRSLPPRRAISARSIARQGSAQMPVLKNIYRYPIKGLSAQPLNRIDLEARKPLPHDRIFALVRPGAPFDTSDPKWGKKGLFIMLMLEEALARVRTTLDVETMRLTIQQDNHQLIAADLGDEDGRAKVEEFFWQLVPSLRSAPTLVRSRDGHFMDKPDNVISLINLATVRSLEAAMGIQDRSAAVSRQFLHRRRRALGGIRMGRQRHRDRRYAVPCRSAQRPLRRHQRQSGDRAPRSRFAGFAAGGLRPQGSRDLSGGQRRRPRHGWRPCHAAAIPGAEAKASPIATAARTGRQLFMCGGCYFIYEPAAGLPGSVDPAGHAVCRDPVELAVPRLRNRQDDVPAACRGPAKDRRMKRPLELFRF